MGKYRGDQINAEFHRALGEIIREVKDPRIPSLCSVTKVQVTPDLKYAKVYVSFFGKKDPEKLMKGLEAASGFIKRELAHKVRVRAIPALTFVLDDSIAYGAHINQVLKSLSPSGEDVSAPDSGKENNE